MHQRTAALAAGVLALLLLLAAGCAKAAPPREFRGMELVDVEPAPEVVATDHHGNPFRLSDLRGHIVLLYFGYTFCPDACPTTMLDFRRVHEALGPDADQLRFVMVTVDPDRDTGEVLAEYIRVRGYESFLGVTGTAAELAPAWADYGIFVEKVEGPVPGVDYWMNHTAATFVIDKAGNLRLMEPWNAGHEMLLNDVLVLLEEDAS